MSNITNMGTDWKIEEASSIPERDNLFLSSPKTSRPVLRTNQPPVQRVQGFFQKARQPKCEADHFISPSIKLRVGIATSLPFRVPYWHKQA
jgi:hypothetical protein